MSSTFNIIAPVVGQPKNANTASYLYGTAQTDTISITQNNPYGGIIQFNNNIRVTNVYGTASMASNLVPQTYYITSSNAINSINSINSNSTNYLNYNPGQNNGTASYAINAINSVTASYILPQENNPYGYIYPYIQAIYLYHPSGQNSGIQNITISTIPKIATSPTGQVTTSDLSTTSLDFYGGDQEYSASFVWNPQSFMYSGSSIFHPSSDNIATNVGVITPTGKPTAIVLVTLNPTVGSSNTLTIVYATGPTNTVIKTYDASTRNTTDTMVIMANRISSNLPAVLSSTNLTAGVIVPVFST